MFHKFQTTVVPVGELMRAAQARSKHFTEVCHSNWLDVIDQSITQATEIVVKDIQGMHQSRMGQINLGERPWGERWGALSIHHRQKRCNFERERIIHYHNNNNRRTMFQTGTSLAGALFLKYIQSSSLALVKTRVPVRSRFDNNRSIQCKPIHFFPRRISSPPVIGAARGLRCSTCRPSVHAFILNYALGSKYSQLAEFRRIFPTRACRDGRRQYKKTYIFGLYLLEPPNLCHL